MTFLHTQSRRSRTSKAQRCRAVACVPLLLLSLAAFASVSWAQEGYTNPAPNAEATPGPKAWTAGSAIGTKINAQGQVTGYDGRMTAPQDQTKSPATPSKVIVEVGKTLSCNVESATDMDHWTRKDQNGIPFDSGDAADTVNYMWAGGTFVTGTNLDGTPITATEVKAQSATWLAPMTPGRYTISCIVDDTPTPVTPPETGDRGDSTVTRSVEVIVYRVDMSLSLSRPGFGSRVLPPNQRFYSIVAGERVYLAAQITPSDANLSITNESWNVGGDTIKYFLADDSSGYMIPLPALIGSSIDFCWYNATMPTNGAERLNSVTYNSTVNGQPYTASVDFAVRKPSAGIMASKGISYIGGTYVDAYGNQKPGTWLHYGTNQGSNVGARFVASGNPTTNVIFSPPSYHMWVQTGAAIDRFSYSGGKSVSTLGFGIDSTYPYSTIRTPPYETSDSPGRGLDPDNNGEKLEVASSLSFFMYFMFSPGPLDSVPVSLSRVQWNWAATARRVGVATAWVLTDNTTPPSTSEANPAYPQWASNLKDKQILP